MLSEQIGYYSFKIIWCTFILSQKPNWILLKTIKYTIIKDIIYREVNQVSAKFIKKFKSFGLIQKSILNTPKGVLSHSACTPFNFKTLNKFDPEIWDPSKFVVPKKCWPNIIFHPKNVGPQRFWSHPKFF